MVTQSRSIQILDPCPEDLPEIKGRSAALSSLEGKVIGLPGARRRDGRSRSHQAFYPGIYLPAGSYAAAPVAGYYPLWESKLAGLD